MKFSLPLVLAATVAYAAPADIAKKTIDNHLLDSMFYYAQYSAATYCRSNHVAKSSPKITCNGNCPQVQDADSNSIIEFRNQGTADATGFVAVDKTQKVIVIAYRGSHSVVNWLANMDFKQVHFICSGCMVHDGFLSSWTATKGPVLLAVNSALADNPGFGIVATGHSLGAAIATLAAADLRAQGKHVALYTYGSPEVGNVAFATSVSLSGPTYRITHQKDAIPYLPGYIAEYAHTFPEYWITSDNGMPVSVLDIVVVNRHTTQGFEGNGNRNNLIGKVLNHSSDSTLGKIAGFIGKVANFFIGRLPSTILSRLSGVLDHVPGSGILGHLQESLLHYMPAGIQNHIWYFNGIVTCAPVEFEITK